MNEANFNRWVSEIQTVKPARPPDSPTIGQIFSSSWGYDQTNVNFYIVTRVTKTQITLIPVQSAVVSVNGPQTMVTVARCSKGHPMGIDGQGPVRRKIKRYDDRNYVEICSYRSAYQWDGRPQYKTTTGYGH